MRRSCGNKNRWNEKSKRNRNGNINEKWKNKNKEIMERFRRI